jgi:hypothetical protein
MNLSILSATAWQRFLELLPWYVNGTLSIDERFEMEFWLAVSAKCRTELAYVVALASEVKRTSLPLAQRDEAAGLAQLMARVHAQDSGKLALRTIGGAGVKRALQNAMAKWHKQAIAIAAALAIVQTGVLVNSVYQAQDNSVIKPLGAAVGTSVGDGTSVRKTALLQVTFRASASEAQIRGLLDKLGAEIISGPGALGVYSLKIASERGDATLTALRNAQDVVDSAAMLTN